MKTKRYGLIDMDKGGELVTVVQDKETAEEWLKNGIIKHSTKNGVAVPVTITWRKP